MEIPFQPLDGRFVRLEPLVPSLQEDLRAALDCDPESWAIMPESALGQHFDRYWSSACNAPPTERLAWAIRRIADDRIVGTSSFYLAAAHQSGVEIGSTFLHPDARSGPVNPESKMLMLQHAFAAGALRVQFRVDTRNRRSQAAVAKLGALREGVLRWDRITWTGFVRDTAYFSILSHEWPQVRTHLQQRLAGFS